MQLKTYGWICWTAGFLPGLLAGMITRDAFVRRMHFATSSRALDGIANAMVEQWESL